MVHQIRCSTRESFRPPKMCAHGKLEGGLTVGVKHFRQEAHIGRLVRVLLAELDLEAERPALPRRVVGAGGGKEEKEVMEGEEVVRRKTPPNGTADSSGKKIHARTDTGCAPPAPPARAPSPDTPHHPPSPRPHHKGSGGTSSPSRTMPLSAKKTHPKMTACQIMMLSSRGIAMTPGLEFACILR